MPQLIKGRAAVADDWTLLREAGAADPLPADGAIIVPLAVWLAKREEWLVRGNVGVWLAPADDPAALAQDVATLPVVAVDFPVFTDGRGYSTCRLLRERYGYRGELRAIGDVGRDQLFLLAQCGFDAFLIPEPRDAVAALAGLDDFESIYAPTVSEPQPWFRRRENDAPAEDRWTRCV